MFVRLLPATCVNQRKILSAMWQTAHIICTGTNTNMKRVLFQQLFPASGTEISISPPHLRSERERESDSMSETEVTIPDGIQI